MAYRGANSNKLEHLQATPMKQLVNFSVYPADRARFDNDWRKLRDYTQNLGLDGIELLLGFDPPPTDIPAGLVQAVHLPFWITWLDVWRGRPGAAARYFPGVPPAELKYYCGGESRVAVIELNRRLWSSAAKLSPAYAVFHVSHVEMEHAFTRRFSYANAEVIAAAANILNTVAASFPAGEPPVHLLLENLWWPGLTFTHHTAELLAEQLEFSNWGFVLDTGHLMNTNSRLDDEEAAIEFVLETVAALPQSMRARIEALHFSLSTSGEYQRAQMARGLPPGFAEQNLFDRLEASRRNALNIDQHRPFTHPRCAEIVDAVQPQSVTHEFLSRNLAELDDKLRTQLATLQNLKKYPLPKRANSDFFGIQHNK